MLVLLLCSFFVLSSGIPMRLKSKRNITNIKSLVEELADADPGQVQELYDLIQTMLQDANDSLDNLELVSTTANGAYDDAVVVHNAAVLEHDGAQSILDDAITAEGSAKISLDDAQEAKDQAQGRSEEAEFNLNNGKPVLEGEISDLEREIIDVQLEITKLEEALVRATDVYNAATVTLTEATSAYQGALDDVGVAQTAKDLAQGVEDDAQSAKDVAEGVKIEAQHNLDTGKPNLQLEIANLMALEKLHASLNPAKFTLGLLAINECPRGYKRIDNDASLCEVAANAVGIEYEGGANMLDQADATCNFCGGCSPATVRIDGTHGGLAQFVCQRNKFSLGLVAVNECQEGSQRIDNDADLCQFAANVLGMEYESGANRLDQADATCNFCGGCSPATVRIDGTHGDLAQFVCQ